MSTESYSKWWIQTQQNLEHLQKFDLDMAKMKKVKDRSLANQLLGGLYARYSIVIQDMDACFSQMVQVQKNFTIRKLIDAAVFRLNELKEELTKLDISEYHYIDGALVELKLIPHEVEIIHPQLVFPRDVEYEQFWQRLKNDEIIYEAPAPAGSELAEGEDGAKKAKKKKKPKQVDPLAMLAGGGAAPPVEEEPLAEEGVEAQTEGAGEGDEPTTDQLTSLRIHKKKVRPKFVYQPADALLTDAEREQLVKKERLVKAIELIQSHERARQARLYFNDLRGSRATIAKNRPSAMPTSRASASRRSSAPPRGSGVVPAAISGVLARPSGEITEVPKVEIIAPRLSRESAVIAIQRFWRGYSTRQNLKRLETKRRLLIGMYEPSYRSPEEFIKMRKSFEHRRRMRDNAVREYIKANIDENARVLRVVAPGLFEDIGEEIRQWFKDWYYQCKVFMDIPPEEKGGTILLVRGELETPEQHFKEMVKTSGKQKDQKKNDQAKEKAKKEAEEKKKKEQEKAKKAREKAEAKKKKAEDYEYEPGETAATKNMDEGFKEYMEMWAKVNDADNPQNKPYMDLITEQKCYEMQLEVRSKVDEVMRIELQLLRGAIEKDKWLAKKKKKGKFKPKKQKAKKAPKAKKGKKGKKDPTGDRKVEDLFQELYQNGIIRKYPEVYIDQYMGDFSYQNWEKRASFRDPPATIADARQAVIMNCILPLGVEKMVRPKAVLLVGPRGSGLDMLANAVFNETQCVLFDLSSSNVGKKYPGKKGNKELIHLITKMSRLLSPSIIYVGDADKTFCKKVPKEEKGNDPKRVGKFLAKKIIKPITPADRVLVLGTTNLPWLAQAKIKKTFPTVILVPRTDYGSVFLFWNKLLMPFHGVDRNINLTSVSTMSLYFPFTEIRDAVNRILVPERIIQLKYKPLEPSEIWEAIAQGAGPVDDKEWAKYVKFYAGTKLGKQRKKLMKVFETLLEKESKEQQAEAGRK